MVNLSARQTAILKDLTAAKVQYDRETEQFEHWLAQQAAGRKARIAELVREAESAKVPQARIYNTLGFDQPAPYQRFIRPGLEVTAGGGTLGSGYVPSTPSPIEEEPEDVGPFTLTPGNSDEADPWLATDKNGKVYKLMFGGASAQTPHSFIKWQLEEIPEKYREEIKQEIEAYHNGWVTWD